MKKVYLLYEGDKWLTNSSLVLMGVFTSDEELRHACDKLIRQRIDKNYEAEGYDDGWNKEEMKDALAQRIVKELLENRQTQTYTINYTIKEVELNKLGEI